MFRIASTGLLVLSIAIGLSGCATKKQFNFQMESASMTLTSEPSGATVTQIMPFVNERVRIGQTPAINQQVQVLSKAKGKHLSTGEMSKVISQLNAARLEFSKPGYVTVVENYGGPTEAGETAAHHVVLEPVDTAPPASPSSSE